MATRTIEEIKESIAADFMDNETVAELYDFPVGDNFTKHFSRISIINILFYIFAAAAWVQENLFEAHQKEVEERIEEAVPHRAKWYCDKVLKFMKDKLLMDDSDQYDLSQLSEDAIATARVIKHVVAVEDPESSVLILKVRGEAGKLDEETEEQLSYYISEIKDAGVRIELINQEADTFNCEVDIYYNPLLLAETVEANCREKIEQYIRNLPFNGEYTHMDLIQQLKEVEGVKIVQILQVTTCSDAATTDTIVHTRYTPEAGYFKAGEISLNLYVYE